MPFGEFCFAEDWFYRVELCGEFGFCHIACGVLRLEGVGVAAFFQIRINGCSIRIYGQFPVLFAASFSVELCDAYVVAVGQGDGERIVPVLCVFAVG